MENKKLYKDKYRMESTRLKHWDYSNAAYYYVTICCNNMRHYFGTIADGEMKSNTLGEIIETKWFDIVNHHENVLLDEYIVMPNHFHGIVIINKNSCKDIEYQNHEKWKAGTLGVIINHFKRSCTIECREINPSFQWKPRFHDRIIRDEKELTNVRKYIQDNPKRFKPS